MCLAYHTTVNCVNQTNQCATVREYQGLTYNGTANYSYTWDCDFKWYHEDKSCRDDY